MEHGRSPQLEHHIGLGRSWLEKSDGGTNAVALSYAAFELRLAAERLALHYWSQILDRPLEESDLRDVGSFKRMEQRIYELAGNQRLINGHFEFMRTVLVALKIDRELPAPNLGQLSAFWHACSELCHLKWNLASESSTVRSEAFVMLTAAAEAMNQQVADLSGFPVIRDSEFSALEREFVAGRVDSLGVYRFLETRGAWARVAYRDGRPGEFIGEAIPPEVRDGNEG